MSVSSFPSMFTDYCGHERVTYCGPELLALFLLFNGYRDQEFDVLTFAGALCDCGIIVLRFCLSIYFILR